MNTKDRLTFAAWQGVLLLCVASVACAAEGPYGGTPAPVPGTVMAENYDTGGSGVAYNVNSVNGTDNGYRSDGVDLETASSPATGNDLGWTSTGQWFRYTVNVSTAGTYNVSFLVAGNTASSDAFHLSNSSGTNLTGSVAVPATGGWQTWTTVTATVTLPAGTQTLTLNQDNGGWNIDAMTFASSSLPYNVNAIYTNGTSFSTGGADGNGYAFSATLLGATQTFNGTTFTYGPSNAVDAFKNVTIPVTAGSYSGLNVLGFAVNSNEASQTFTIHYTNGTTSTDTQSLSDWCSPQSYSGETTVKTMSYRNTSSGGEDTTTCYVYGYTLAVNSSLTVSSVTLPANNNVIVMGVQPIAQSSYNVNAIYTNGTTFSSSGGADGNGFALSATLLGATQAFNGTIFTYGPSNAPDAFRNVTIPLTAGTYSGLNMLGFAVNGNQTSQTFTIHYTNGTTSTDTQSMSDWCGSQGYSGETKVVTMSYRNTSGGGEDSTTCYVYGYALAVNSSLTVSSVTIPANNNVIVLGIQPILQSSLPYNIYAIDTNGTSFATGGADGSGNALSATLLGATQAFNGTTFTYGPSNTPNAYSGQTVALTPGSFSSLNILAFAIDGSQPSQTFQVNYTNGTYTTDTQSMSDWCSPQGYSGETTVKTMSYRNTSSGGEDSTTCNVYGYTLPVTSSLTVKSLTLPENSNVIVLGVQDQAPSGPIRRTASEVLLVYNSNSPISTAIANYYEQERGVTNVVAVNCQDSALSINNETITLANYTSEIANPISSYLSSHSGINFIVLTKGVPIRILGALTGSVGTGGALPSVDSYLAAIDYPNIPTAVKVPITGSLAWMNRYYNKSVPFTHAQFGGYLVTRLDGYTQADAEAVVTNAIAAEQNLGSGPVLLDGSPSYGINDPSPPILAAPLSNVTGEESYAIWNTDMARAGDILQASGISVDSVYTNTFVGNMTNLLGYYSWGSNDGNFNSAAYESLAFIPGAIGDTAVSSSARSLLPDNDGGQSLITDLIAHGITGVRGYVNEPLLDAISSPTIVYTHFMSGYSLAESFYAGSRYVGWEDINIGDPLCTPYWGKYTIVLPTTFNTPPLQ